MDSLAIKQAIFQGLQHRLTPTGDADLFMTRCPLCGDSQKDERKKRFYIRFHMTDPARPIEYICFNCNEKGYMKPSVLRAFSMNQLSVNSGLLKMNQGQEKRDRKEKKLLQRLQMTIPLYPDTPKYRERKEYIEDRLGIPLSYEDLHGLKAVLDLSTFLKTNQIGSITCRKEKALLLEKQYVGFLSSMDHMVIFRNMRKDKNKPHQKYMLLPGVESYKFYTIPSQVKRGDKETIDIHIAEGVYDILGVYYHIRNQNRKNQIYIGATGSSFRSVLDYYIENGILGNAKLHIYSDQDKSPYFHKRLIEDCDPFFLEVHLYYNRIGKDYGVQKNEIRLEEYRG